MRSRWNSIPNIADDRISHSRRGIANLRPQTLPHKQIQDDSWYPVNNEAIEDVAITSLTACGVDGDHCLAGGATQWYRTHMIFVSGTSSEAGHGGLVRCLLCCWQNVPMSFPARTGSMHRKDSPRGSDSSYSFQSRAASQVRRCASRLLLLQRFAHLLESIPVYMYVVRS